MMTVELTEINAKNVPKATLEYLRPHAQRNGQGRTDAAVTRFALVELERRIKADVDHAAEVGNGRR